jgi:dTDP-4-amino-4,6-dideoxygalactose transaminase
LIPFNVPYVPEASKKYVLEALEGTHQQGDGPFTVMASKLLSNLVGGGHVLLTPSCTHALEMASMLAKIGPGDEVILPSYTFTSAATAVTKFGATPVFVDIELQTKGIDVQKTREAITPKTKAISWVNYAGVAPDIDALQRLAREFNLLLIEDNAHGLGGTYKGKPLGSFGDFATQSFHASKNIQCGEGGALVINNLKFIERAEMIREKGTDRSKYNKGEIEKYQWVDEGSSYLLAESLSAILLGQLESFDEIQATRREICGKYSSLDMPPGAISNSSSANFVAHMFYVQFLHTQEAIHFKNEMNNLEISVSTHYQSLANSTYAKNNSIKSRFKGNSEHVTQNLLRFPLFFNLSEFEVDRIFREASILLGKMRTGIEN